MKGKHPCPKSALQDNPIKSTGLWNLLVVEKPGPSLGHEDREGDPGRPLQTEKSLEFAVAT